MNDVRINLDQNTVSLWRIAHRKSSTATQHHQDNIFFGLPSSPKASRQTNNDDAKWCETGC